jgi:hypothetical protein
MADLVEGSELERNINDNSEQKAKRPSRRPSWDTSGLDIQLWSIDSSHPEDAIWLNYLSKITPRVQGSSPDAVMWRCLLLTFATQVLSWMKRSPYFDSRSNRYWYPVSFYVKASTKKLHEAGLELRVDKKTLGRFLGDEVVKGEMICCGIDGSGNTEFYRYAPRALRENAKAIAGRANSLGIKVA